MLLSTKSKPKIATEPRELSVFFKLDHVLRDEGCSNPNCVDDTRPANDIGRRIVVKIGDEYVCRECFLAGYLSESSQNAERAT